MKIEAERIQDHKMDGDDVDTIAYAKLSKMDRFERFEYSFPFYKMDVNGYIVHIKAAMKIYQPNTHS